jgi:hypothetical protein
MLGDLWIDSMQHCVVAARISEDLYLQPLFPQLNDILKFWGGVQK